VWDQLVQTDFDEEHDRVTKHKKLTPYRIETNMQKLLNYFNKTEDTIESRVHVKADEAAHEEHNTIGSQLIRKKDVMTVLFGR